MPKLPGKFDDISKTATSVLNDDFQCGIAGDKAKGSAATNQFQFKTKSKCAAGGYGGTAELEVDVGNQKADSAQTPAKMTFKVPKGPVPGLSIDKFEIASKGGAKVEMGLGKSIVQVDGLKVDLKFDIKDYLPLSLSPDKYLASTASYGLGFTGIKDWAIKLDGKLNGNEGKKKKDGSEYTETSGPMDSSLEVLHARDIAGIGCVIGAKWEGGKWNDGVQGPRDMCPNVNLSFAKDKFFLALATKKRGAEIDIYKHYKVSDDIAVAGSYALKDGAFKVACSAKVLDGTAKAKYTGNDLFLAFKKDLAKGTTFVGGMKFDIGGGDHTFGAKLSID